MATEKGRIYRQRKRRGVKVRRFEVAFNPNYGTDHDAIDFLDALPRGTKSDFARDAILKAIAGERHTMTEHSFDTVIDDLRADNAALRDMLSDALDRLADLQQREYTVIMQQEQRIALSTQPPPDDTQTASAGIDMSRDRPRKLQPCTDPAPISAPEELTEAESIRLAQVMAASIRKAQPGRQS